VTPSSTLLTVPSVFVTVRLALFSTVVTVWRTVLVTPFTGWSPPGSGTGGSETWPSAAAGARRAATAAHKKARLQYAPSRI
jgi:hypothetical protein